MRIQGPPSEGGRRAPRGRGHDELLEWEERVFVALDPVIDPANRPLRTEDVERLVAVEIRTDDPVESHEVVEHDDV